MVSSRGVRAVTRHQKRREVFARFASAQNETLLANLWLDTGVWPTSSTCICMQCGLDFGFSSKLKSFFFLLGKNGETCLSGPAGSSAHPCGSTGKAGGRSRTSRRKEASRPRRRTSHQFQSRRTCWTRATRRCRGLHFTRHRRSTARRSVRAASRALSVNHSLFLPLS